MTTGQTLPLVLLALTLNGCLVAAAAVGAAAVYGAIKYTDNGAQEDFRAGVNATFGAAVEALKEHGYEVPASAAPTATEGHIATRDVDVTITRFRAHPDDFTRVKVAVGTFDTEEHRRRAGLILGAIRRHLGE